MSRYSPIVRWVFAATSCAAFVIAIAACTSFDAAPLDPDDGGTSGSDGGGTDGGADRTLTDDGSSGGSSYARAVLDDAPIAYFRLGEKSGNTVTAVGGGTIGTINNGGVLAQPGAILDDPDTCLSLEGTGFVNLGQGSFDFDKRHAFALEVWIRPSATDGNYRMIFAREIINAGNQIDTYGVFVRNSIVTFERYVSGTGISVTNGSAPANQWTHVVASYDGDRLFLFVNGAEVENKADGRMQPSKPTPLLVGDGNAAAYLGLVDEIAIYDKALPAARARAHFKASGR